MSWRHRLRRCASLNGLLPHRGDLGVCGSTSGGCRDRLNKQVVQLQKLGRVEVCCLAHHVSCKFTPAADPPALRVVQVKVEPVTQEREHRLNPTVFGIIEVTFDVDGCCPKRLVRRHDLLARAAERVEFGDTLAAVDEDLGDLEPHGGFREPDNDLPAGADSREPRRLLLDLTSRVGGAEFAVGVHRGGEILRAVGARRPLVKVAVEDGSGEKAYALPSGVPGVPIGLELEVLQEAVVGAAGELALERLAYECVDCVDALLEPAGPRLAVLVTPCRPVDPVARQSRNMFLDRFQRRAKDVFR